MKIFFILCLFSSSLFAGYGKPELLARYSGIDSFNAPDGLYCFTAEPLPTKEGVLMGCLDGDGQSLMMRFSNSYEVLANSELGLFSKPLLVDKKSAWYEFNESGVRKLYEYQGQELSAIDLRNLGPLYALIDSFVPVRNNTYVYRLQDESKKLLSWKNHIVSDLYTEDISHIFPPVSSVKGDFLIKVRRLHLNEDAPDELLKWDGEFKSLLKDRDSDPTSPFKSFRHQFALDENLVALIATDDRGEALFLIENGQALEVARAGVDLQSFDFFSPKLRNGVLAFRGIDLQKRRALWVFEKNELRKILTQGDVVKTDKGLARVDYRSQDALFYGSPGVSEEGDIFQQATLTDIDHPLTLLGIGLIKLNKE
jgi:hypothetical protein